MRANIVKMDTHDQSKNSKQEYKMLLIDFAPPIKDGTAIGKS